MKTLSDFLLVGFQAFAKYQRGTLNFFLYHKPAGHKIARSGMISHGLFSSIIVVTFAVFIFFLLSTPSPNPTPYSTTPSQPSLLRAWTLNPSDIGTLQFDTKHPHAKYLKISDDNRRLQSGMLISKYCGCKYQQQHVFTVENFKLTSLLMAWRADRLVLGFY